MGLSSCSFLLFLTAAFVATNADFFDTLGKSDGGFDEMLKSFNDLSSSFTPETLSMLKSTSPELLAKLASSQGQNTAEDNPFKMFSPEMILNFLKDFVASPQGQNAAEDFSPEMILKFLRTIPVFANFLKNVDESRLNDLIKESVEKRSPDVFFYRFRELLAAHVGGNGDRFLQLLQVVVQHDAPLAPFQDFYSRNSESPILTEVKDLVMKHLLDMKTMTSPEAAFGAFRTVLNSVQFQKLFEEFMKDPSVNQFIEDNWVGGMPEFNQFSAKEL